MGISQRVVVLFYLDLSPAHSHTQSFHQKYLNQWNLLSCQINFLMMLWIGCYLPMQKLLKINPRISSLATRPVKESILV